MIEQIEFRLLFPNPFQPKSRWPIDRASVADLANSIRERGGFIHVPVGRRLPNGRIEIGVGHRRCTAWPLAFPDRAMPIDIRDLDDRQMYDYVIDEGAQRLDWSALEKGERMTDYMARFGVSQTETAKRFKVSQGAASNLMRLARETPDGLRPLIQARQLPERFARTLVSLARIDAKAAVSIGKEIAVAKPDEREKLAGELTANFLGDHAHALDRLDWPADWKPAEPVALERKGSEIQNEMLPACDDCPYTERALGDVYCTRPKCWAAKTALWTQHELERVSKKFRLTIAAAGERCYDVAAGWHNEKAIQGILNDKSAERDHLRLAAVESNAQLDYYMKDLLGSKKVQLVSTKSGYKIEPKAEPNKGSGCAKPAPENETPAQKAKREAREEKEREQRREAKSALRRGRADCLWLLATTSKRMAAPLVIAGGVVEYCYQRMDAQGYFTHQDWPEFTEYERALLEEMGGSTGDAREDCLRQLILLGEMRRKIAAFRPEEEFDAGRARQIVAVVIGETFKLRLPHGWDDIPIHTTPNNCHVCGKFTSNAEMTGVDRNAGWGALEAGGRSIVYCPDCGHDGALRLAQAMGKSKSRRDK